MISTWIFCVRSIITAYRLICCHSNGTTIPIFLEQLLKKIYRIYEFDRSLRTLLFSTIEEIELYLRTQLAYYSTHKHGALAYLDPQYYNKQHDHEKFTNTIDAAIHNHKNTPVVQHHNLVYGGAFPIWVIVDFLSIGNLSYFYADWLTEDKKYIAKNLFGTTYPFLDSWMKCIQS